MVSNPEDELSLKKPAAIDLALIDVLDVTSETKKIIADAVAETCWQFAR